MIHPGLQLQPLSRLLHLSTFGFGRSVTIATQFSKENIHHAYSSQFNPQQHPSKGAIVAKNMQILKCNLHAHSNLRWLFLK